MRWMTILAAMVGLCCALSASALGVGDPAPAITVAKWVKGEPVKELEKGKVYVVEFWATWCGPCRTSIPHLTELAHANKDVTFIGVSVWEQDDSAVEPFVTEMGEKMDYRVATDDKTSVAKGAMAENWMTAAKQNGIPAAFIINKDQQIAWIGHPMGMDKVLPKVIDGSYDLETAKNEAAAEAAQRDEMEAVQKAFQAEVVPLLQKQDWVGGLKAMDEFIAKNPKVKPQLLNLKLRIAQQGKQYDVFYATADEVLDGSDDAQKLNAVAWTVAAAPGIEKRDLDRAAKWADRAVELTKGAEPGILDTQARIYFEKGDIAKAVSIQEKAVSLCTDADMKKELEASLAKYKEKLPK